MTAATDLSPALAAQAQALQLNYAPIDDLHQAFFEHLAAFEGLPEGVSWLAPLQALRTHLAEHFEAENEMMTQFGPEAFGCHKTEHTNVLKVVDEVLRRVAMGEWQIGKNLVQELPVWFEHHVQTMDNVLAHSMKESINQEDCRGASCAA
ncbi:hemerythrin domain-containing protein [Parvibium lacunae]|uniref:Bacteriohemerythrin n=1 Tax=Parvibium lacunae TaxID=1888893 RepID=A0A368KZZ7_9BURK|nr:hemerythrin domain-containing protein [Parvibium lacunae]RCS56877.1 bacteriohemerythrin [Parvibium lacunae]